VSARAAVLQLLCAAVAAVVCVWSWRAAQSVVEVAPIADGEPSTTSVVYSAPQLSLAFVFAAVAGMLAVAAIANLRRR